jgi:transmembrane 9 superfamily member 2/4
MVFGVFFLLNIFVWAKGSSGAVPFSTMLALVLIWFVISVPLSVAGSWVGFKQKVYCGFFVISVYRQSYIITNRCEGY